GTDAWAPTLVSQAADALEAARAAYVAQQDREYLAARDDRDYARWVDDVRYGYNTSLRDFCGPTSASLIDDPAFDAALCARNTADERCNIGEHEYYAMWTQADLDGRLCRHRLIDNRGNGRFTFTTTSALGITDQGVR